MSAGEIALIVSIAGWVVTHAFTLRAQRRQFLNSVKDDARKDVVAAIRREQHWALAVDGALRALPMIQLSEQHGMRVDWFAEWRKLHGIIYDGRGNLLMVFEEYENVFPETKTCRWEVATASRELAERATEINQALLYPAERAAAIAKAEKLANENDVGAFMEDLRVHVQNRVLGEITGWKVAQRRVRDETLPRILPDADGNLRIQR
jgi:hypothetical protein